jgi:hypothetical protein
MTEIPAVEVSMHMPAPPEDVFPYFTDPARYVQWMGSEAKLEPVPGGGTASTCPTVSRPPASSFRSPSRTGPLAGSLLPLTIMRLGCYQIEICRSRWFVVPRPKVGVSSD